MIKIWNTLLKQGVYPEHVLKQSETHLQDLKNLEVDKNNKDEKQEAITEVQEFIASLKKEHNL